MLEALQLFDALLLGDVAPDAQVATEATGLVEQRLAAQRKPDPAAIVRQALDFEILERLMALDLRAMRIPVGLGEVQRRLVGARGAKIGREVDPQMLAEPAGQIRETQLPVLDPEPV